MRCAVYIRVSTDKEEQKASLKYQKELFYRFIEEQGWDVYEFYVDVQSGTTAKRKNLQRMIQDAQDKRFDVILAKELSRLARNGELSYQIKNLCENQDIHIITLDNAINTLEGKTNMFGLYAWLYEQESQNTSNRIKESLRTRAKNGLFKGAIPPYGYEIKDGKLFIRNDETPDIVRRIYKEYLQGHGRHSIARKLYNENVKTPADVAGKRNASDKWNDSTIRFILTNPHYVGDLVQGRTSTVSVTSKKRKQESKDDMHIIKDTHEPIISRDTFEAVQNSLKQRKRYFTAPKRHLFTNVLFCADCGKGLWFRSNRKNGYVCGNYARFGKKACSAHMIREDFLKEAILSDIKEIVRQIDEEHYIKKLEEKSKKSTKDVEKKLETLDKQIDTLKTRKKNFLKMLADEKIDHEEYLEMAEDNSAELAQLMEKKKQIASLIDDDQIIDNINSLKQELRQFLTFNELTPEILHRLVNRIDVKADGTPIIHYRFAAPMFE